MKGVCLNCASVSGIRSERPRSFRSGTVHYLEPISKGGPKEVFGRLSELTLPPSFEDLVVPGRLLAILMQEGASMEGPEKPLP